MEQPIELQQDAIIIGRDFRGRPIARLRDVPPPTDIPEPRDPDADPTTPEGWAAMMERRDLHIRGGRGGRGGSGGREVVVPFVAHDVRPADCVDLPARLRFGTRLTIGEYEFYHQHPGEALRALREEISRILADGTVTVVPVRKRRKAGEKRVARPRAVDCQIHGLEEREIVVLRASRSGTAALAAYARANDGERIRWREGV